MRISDWSSDVCSSDLAETPAGQPVDIVPFDRRRTPARAGRAEHAFGEQHVEIRNLAARPHAADRPARWPRLARQARANRRRKTQRLLIAMRETRSEEQKSELQSLMRISYAVFCLNKNKNK